ncbi:MAG: metalloregulator ArsR/SmtB family transcription factor [Pseudomonadota bacterium]
MLTEQQLDDTFAALAHPVRRALLARLAQGGATVNELAAPFEVSLPAVSRHLKVLERSGLIRRGQDAQFRPCELNADPLREVVTWAEQYRPIWEARFDQMETCLATLAGDDNGD